MKLTYVEETQYFHQPCGRMMDLKLPDDYRLHWAIPKDYVQGDIHLVRCEFYLNNSGSLSPIENYYPTYVSRMAYNNEEIINSWII